jgi:predicted ester cyclase
MGDAVETVQRYDDAFNAHDVEARRAALSDRSELWMPGGMRLQGPDQIIGIVHAFWGALPDGKLMPERQISDGTDVATEGRLQGTHTGPFPSPQGDIPPTGNRVEFAYVSVRRVEGDTIVSEHLYFDQLEFLQQIGAMPAP